MGADGNDPSERISAGFTVRAASLAVYTPISVTTLLPMSDQQGTQGVNLNILRLHA